MRIIGNRAMSRNVAPKPLHSLLQVQVQTDGGGDRPECADDFSVHHSGDDGAAYCPQLLGKHPTAQFISQFYVINIHHGDFGDNL